MFRKSLIILIVLLAACSPTVGTLTPTPGQSGPSALSVAVASNDFATGAPRVPFVLFLGSQPIGDARSVTVTAFDLSSGTPVPGWSGAATPFTDYELPYWVVLPEIPSPGYWGLGVIVTLSDGSAMPAQFTIQAMADVSAPAVGEAPPALENRTLTTEPDLAKLTSDPAPEAGLYRLTVAEALASGKPSVVVVATPGFCESRLCAPVVDSVKAVYARFKDQVNFIHIEVYQTFDPLVYGPEMDAWHLTSEPWTFVLDRDGKVVHRLGGPVSPEVLSAALAPLVAP